MRGSLFVALVALASSVDAASAQEAPPEQPAAPVEITAPQAGAWLRYEYEQHVEAGTGEYEGYRESTSARARYDVVSVEGDTATIRGQYSWTYRSPERNDEGTEDRTVAFMVGTRRYAQRQTDSSDYDAQDGTTLATWIWIRPDVEPGARLPILEHEAFEVLGIEELTSAGAPRRAIHLRAGYEEDKDDAYGRRRSSIVDEYWYDAETGMFLRERVVEDTRGTLEGRPMSFRLVTTIELVDSSYAPAVAPPPAVDDSAFPAYDHAPYDSPSYPPPPAASSRRDPFVCAVVVAAIALGCMVVMFLVLRRRRTPRTTAGGERFVIESVSGAPGPIPPGLSPTFDPFLGHMAHVAQASGNKLALARGDGGRLLGLAIGDRDTNVGTIFATDSDVCEALRGELGTSEFFSELRHPKLASVAKSGAVAPAEAYNLYETFEVMALDAPPADLGYDTELVSPYTPQHRAGTVALLTSVYGVACDVWLDASIGAGDVAWVAHEGDRIIGLAMASLCGAHARLHTLSVHPDHQNKGVGTALYRARLRGLFDLGATRVITECATWNLAALEIARAHGFSKAGVMYVESARDQKVERRFVRR